MSELVAQLAEALSAVPRVPLRVGFSGGLDSTVLLHVLARVPAARERDLRALHVCHHLHPDADAWAREAHAFAEHLGVPFQLADVTVSTITEEGVEAAARRARYAAFADHLPDSAIIALAHHRDDQVETVLLRLLHGAGQEGLTAMRPWRPLARGDDRQIWRPLLDVPKAQLEAYAKEHGLHYIDDPANHHPDYLRNRVRQSVVPALRTAFADADARIADAAGRLRSEADALTAVACRLLEKHTDPADGSIACLPLRTLPPALVRRVISLWLDKRQLPRPAAGIWEILVPELVNARADAKPELAWQGARLRRYKDRLHADAGEAGPRTDWQLDWNGKEPLTLPDGLGTLGFEPPPTDPLKLLVRPRSGGETLLWRGHRRSAKKLLQQSAVPPWRRPCLPFVFDHGGELMSIAGRWNSDGFSQWMAQQHIRLHLYYDDGCNFRHCLRHVEPTGQS